VTLPHEDGEATPQPDITTLLGLAGQGDRQAQEALYPLVEAELRKRAAAHMRHEHVRHDLQTTILIDDAYLKLVGQQNMTWESRAQFYCLAARVMGQILVDDFRKLAAARRGGGKPTHSLDQVSAPVDWQAADPLQELEVHEALNKLAQNYPDLIAVFRLRYYGGWELTEIADILNISQSTVKRRWENAVARLRRELFGDRV
jgi:RNA polymerase sigma factor (TIGR02999 family)